MLSKMVTVLFPDYFGSYFCYHYHGKRQINTRLLHLGFCSNKEEIGEKQICFFFASKLDHNCSFMHVASLYA